MRHEAAKL